MTSPLFPKTPLPCLHVWEFHRADGTWDDYFKCTKCGKEAPYEPEDLADMMEELYDASE